MSKTNLIAWGIFLFGVAMIGLFYWFTVPGSKPQVVNEAPIEYGGPQMVITVAGEANGEIVIELFDTLAPKHVERLSRLAAEHAYDGVVFHRVIDGFMAQTGDVQYGRLEGLDMRYAGSGGSDYEDLPAEFSKEDFHRGIVGMARTQDPDSANSQFFIMFADGPHLKGNYTVIGRVIEGMDVVDAIKRGNPSNGTVTGAPDVMQSVRVRPATR
ncbi:MAG: peptidylprolyl isomerase [Rhodobacterales bacterium]|nr:MAG: peptidylprolyl isomerase [Rhodobacterales bacterium]